MEPRPSMPITLDPHLRRALVERIRFYNELGIYDFYRRETNPLQAAPELQPEPPEETTLRAKTVVVAPAMEEDLFAAPKPESRVKDPAKALRIVREDLGDCTRCRLHKQGRKQIVFGVGNPQADLIFSREAPCPDHDEQAHPFVATAGQLPNNMIKAMALQPRHVY